MIHSTNSNIDRIIDDFEHIKLSPEAWPIVVSAAISGDRTLKQWPEFPKAATLPFNRIGHGCGLNWASARRSATAELVEIASCAGAPSSKPIKLSMSEALEIGAWLPNTVNGFSERQLSRRTEWNERLRGFDWIPPMASRHAPIDWVSAVDPVNNEHILVPMEFAVIGQRETYDDNAICVADTNGCAAGASVAEARLAALCELIERDATGRWWYGNYQAPLVDIRTELVTEASTLLRGVQRRLQMFDITSDLQLPTIAAISASEDGRFLSVGFSSKPDRLDAIDSSVLELLMIELKFRIYNETRESDPNLSAWIAETDLQTIAEILGGKRSEEPAILEQEISEKSCLDAITRAGCRVAFIDFTNANFGIPVFRAISPDLAHWKPRLGRPRMKEILPHDHFPDRSFLRL